MNDSDHNMLPLYLWLPAALFSQLKLTKILQFCVSENKVAN